MAVPSQRGAIVTATSQPSPTRSSTSSRFLAFPLIVRSFGTVLMFLPMNMATLGPIPKNEVGAASGFFSLTRQLGGSIGVALLTTLLDTCQAFAPETLERVRVLTGAMMAKGFDMKDAHEKALALLDGSVSVQAAVMSFCDTFWATGAILVVTLPLVFLLGKGGGKVEMGHGRRQAVSSEHEAALAKLHRALEEVHRPLHTIGAAPRDAGLVVDRRGNPVGVWGHDRREHARERSPGFVERRLALLHHSLVRGVGPRRRLTERRVRETLIPVTQARRPDDVLADLDERAAGRRVA
jgi:hypothetical protein